VHEHVFVIIVDGKGVPMRPVAPRTGSRQVA
jgi:hypothetical protein